MRTSKAQVLGGLRVSERSPTSDLVRLGELDLDHLRQRWRRLLGRAAPPNLSRQLLVRILAHQLQVTAHGDLSPGTKKLLGAIGKDSRRTGKAGHGVVPPPPELRPLLPGTHLVREHAGVLHRVTVLEEGFAWNGNVYPSLSKIARAITGTSWNGPRFFGLRQEMRGSAKSRSLAGGQDAAHPGEHDPGHPAVSDPHGPAVEQRP